jgi:hypothetical protein
MVTTGTIVAAVVCLAIGLIGAAAIYWSLVIRSTAGYAPYNDKSGAVELDVITAVSKSNTALHAGAVDVPGREPAPGNRA